MTRFTPIAIFAVFLIICQTGLFAATVVVDDSVGSYDLGSHLDLLEDKTGGLTFNDVCCSNLTELFKTCKQSIPNFGFTDSVYWARFTLRNEGEKSMDFILELDYPTMNKVELFEPNQEGGYSWHITGDHLKSASRQLDYRSFVFHLHSPAESSTTYYMRFQSNAINLPLVLWQPEAFTEHVIAWQMALGIYCGILLVIVLYNFFLFISIRESVYLYYVLYVFGFLMTQLCLNGIAMQLLWPDSIWWANHSLLFFSYGCLFFAQQFARSFLITSRVIPRFDKVLTLLMAISIFGLALSLVSYNLAIQFLSVSAFFIIVIWIFTSIWCMKKGVRTARYFLIAWTVFIAGNLMHLLKTLGISPTNFYTNWMDEIGSSLEVILLSLGLASRINRMKRKEKEISNALQVQNLELEQKNLELLDYEKTLEQRIMERTEQLNLKNFQLRKALDGLKVSSKRYKLAKEEAEAANAAKSEFLANMSHELRTPMQGILGFSKLGFDKYGIISAEKVKGFFNEINTSGQRLLHLLNDLLDLSRLESRKEQYDFEKTDLSPLVTIILNELQVLIEEKGIIIEFRKPAFSEEVLADREKILQVLRNLISNAIKFCTESGKIKIEIARQDDRMKLSVIDNGIGIPEKELDMVFDKFIQSSRSKSAAGGTGLGLAISKSIVVAHRGRIWAENNPEGGAIFSFVLPQ